MCIRDRGMQRGADPLGDHSLSSGIGGERIAKHNNIRDCLFQAAQQAGLAPYREVAALLAGSEDCPTDVFLRGWSTGKSTCLHFRATKALQVSTLKGCVEDVAFTVDRRVATKLHKYKERCEAKGLAYIPLAIETFGGWHPYAPW